jgi:LIM-domain binding protein
MMQRYQQQGVMPIGMPNGVPTYNQAQQLAQIKMNMPMQQQQMIQAHQNAQRNIANQQHQQHQQQLLHAQAQQHAALAQQRQSSHQMQISRSQEQPASQPPQPQPTPAPQNQPQPQSQPTSQSQPPTSQPTKAPAPPPTVNNQQQNQPTQQAKQTENDDEPQIKQQDAMNPMIMQDIPKEQIFPKENAILRLILFQDSLANPQRPKDLDYWKEVITKFFSPFGILKHQVPAPDRGGDKTYQLQYPSLARYFQAHFVNGIKQILLQSYEHLHANRSHGETSVTSPNASLTYVFHDDVRVSTQGTLTVLFDEANRIIRLDIAAGSWMEYLPRSVLVPTSPEQGKEGRNKTKKNQAQPPADQTAYLVPPRPVGPWGVPEVIIGWLEVSTHSMHQYQCAYMIL